MFSIFKEYSQNNSLDEFKLPLSKEAVEKLTNLNKTHYSKLIEKYPFNKELNDQEFHQLARGVLISLLATCTDEDDIVNIVDCYHMYIIKIYFIFCVARGFHVNNNLCSLLNTICEKFCSDKEKMVEYWKEFNNNYDDFPMWDALMNEHNFVEVLKKQELKNYNFITVIDDIKEIEDENEDLFEFFMEPIKYFDDEMISPMYVKYIQLCEKHYLPMPNVNE
jgi:hypothetical protein